MIPDGKCKEFSRLAINYMYTQSLEFSLFVLNVIVISSKWLAQIKVGALKSLEEGHEREGVRSDCFLLSELWKAYATWSGFGAESPFILENGNTVIQFYHPTLSALQIYTTQPYTSLRYIHHLSQRLLKYPFCYISTRSTRFFMS